MTRKRLKNIIAKEWEVMSHDLNGLLLITLLPLLIISQSVLYIYLISRFGSEALLAISVFREALQKLASATPGVSSLPPVQQLQVLLMSQLNIYLLLIPIMITVSFATFSIVEEKLSHSLEALLATPVKTWELLLGKTLSGAIPAIIVTWICAGLFITGVAILGWGNLISLVLTPTWYMSLFLLTPMVSVLSFMLGVIGSSKAKDAKSAQNISALTIIPILILIGIQVTGRIWFTPSLTLVLAFGILAIDILVLRAAVKLFQRESIVISWR